MVLTRRGFLEALGLGGYLAAAAHAAPAPKPNIVLCMADDQGWGDVAYNGHPVLETPHLDALAAAGLRFDRFYAAAPVCSPTRASVMTGRTPNRFGCFKWGHTLRPQEITVAEALKTAGYATGHFGKWHLGSVQKGSPVNPGASGFDAWFSAPNFFDNDAVMSREGRAVQTEGESSLMTAEAALAFMREQAAKPGPFLAVVWFGSPHGPHQAAESFRAIYPDEPEKRQHFYGEITALDAAVGRLRTGLDDLGIAGNTLFWYCSDNGGLKNLGRTGGRAHKGSVYEGGLRVPAALAWPARLKQPRTTAMPCVTSDIYPTLLDVVGVTMPHQPPLDGVSLVPLLEGRMTERPKPIGFWDYIAKGVRTPSAEWMPELLEAQRAGKETTDPERLRLDAGEIRGGYSEEHFPGHAAWLDWPWKLHRIQPMLSKEATFELYNLADDPQEARNRFEEAPDRAAAMQAALEAWLRSVVRSLNGADYPAQQG